ncbi:MAG: AAA family ATPase [Eubacteriales bacterium]|nr:AAA family ATPase [Eubacteriales bacterium]
MRIDKLHLQDFGQFHNKDITLAPGINLIYGANEAGKTTTKDFIVDMMYGIEKARGTAARFDHYEKKKPINGSAFSGAMEVTTEQGKYMIERNFSRSEKKTTVRDLDSGREVALAQPNDLLGTLLQTDKNTYLNTLCIGQLGAATDKEIADRLNNYIVNMASTRTGDIDAVNAIMALKNKKKEFSNKELEQKEQELTAKLSLDRDFDAELASVKEEYAKAEEQMKNPQAQQLQFSPINGTKKEVQDPPDLVLDEMLSKEERELKMLKNMGPKSVLDNSFVIFVLGLLIMAVFVAIAYVIPGNVPQVKMGIMGFGVAFGLLFLMFVFSKRAKLYRILEDLEIEQGFEDAKAQQNPEEDAQRQMVNVLSELKVKEERIINDRNNQEQYLKELNAIKEKKATNDVELAALDLAIETIQDLSEEIYDTFGSVLNDKVSAIVNRITDGKYTDVKIDDQLRVMVKKGNSYVNMEYLSTGTIEQIYLALRLTIADIIMPERLPVVMDDIFVTYDYQRLNGTLSCLGDYKDHQIIIFATNSGIKDMFANMGIECNYISLS